ncbi:MAG: hypothetical protein HFE49_08195 [Clostridia bacterium]|nr:hypothetical protein [Clostridia bacterium]
MLLASVAVIAVVSIVMYVLMVVAYWNIFKKAGEPGWKSIIPVYNSYILFKISWSTVIFWITLVIGFVTGILVNMDNTVATVIVSLLSIVTLVISIMQCYKLSKAFGHGVGFTLGLIFFSPIFMLILAFGSSQYVGKSNN